MRFLCLHGAGTSSELFESQTGLFIAATPTSDGLKIDQAVTNSSATHDTELASMSKSDNATYYAYYVPATRVTVREAVDDLEAYIAEEGPFDGVLAFSQGACLAAMHLVRQSLEQRSDTPSFRCAIFIACPNVYDLSAFVDRGEFRCMNPKDDGHPIQIPTVHIWGEKDGLSEQSRGVSELCEPSMATVFVHEGSHEVPKSSSKITLAGSVKAMRRGIALAALVQRA
ncbi:MAG: hypothetical protein Q9212_003777 [Teloschistes hypoglaucus]